MSANRIQIDSEGYRLEEAVASGTVKPGMIVQKTSTGAVKAHAVAGGRGLVQVAVEDALQGKTIDDSYSNGNMVTYHIQQPGTRFQGILLAAQNVAVGDALISDGAGRLKATLSGDSDDNQEHVLAYAEEAVNANGGVDEFILVRAAAGA